MSEGFARCNRAISYFEDGILEVFDDKSPCNEVNGISVQECVLCKETIFSESDFIKQHKSDCPFVKMDESLSSFVNLYEAFEDLINAQKKKA